MKEKVSIKSKKSSKVSFSFDGKRIITISKNNHIKIYDFMSKNLLSEIEPKNNYIDYYYFKEKLYVIYENSIDIINFDNNIEKSVGLDFLVTKIKVLYNRNIVIFLSTENNLILLDLEKLTLKEVFECGENKITDFSVNEDGTYIMAVDELEMKMFDIKFLSIENKAININNSTKHFIKSKKIIETKKLELTPIGYLHCDKKDRYEAPRQGVHSKDTFGYIELEKYKNFEQGTNDLNGIERVWLIYHFHINDGWKPLVSPPRFHERKIGVFATRSPFRPNPIGISSVKVEKADNLRIYISEFDLLDGTPILDIKPYIPYADSFPDSKTGWLVSNKKSYNVKFSNYFEKQNEWLVKNGDFNIENYAKVQLQFEPDNTFRKRITKNQNGNEYDYILKFRTWFLEYQINHDDATVFVERVQSEYSKEDVLDDNKELKEKEVHIKYYKDFLKA